MVIYFVFVIYVLGRWQGLGVQCFYGGGLGFLFFGGVKVCVGVRGIRGIVFIEEGGELFRRFRRLCVGVYKYVQDEFVWGVGWYRKIVFGGFYFQFVLVILKCVQGIGEFGDILVKFLEIKIQFYFGERN